MNEFEYDLDNSSEESNIVPDDEVEFVDHMLNFVKKYEMYKFGGKLKRINSVKDKLGL